MTPLCFAPQKEQLNNPAPQHQCEMNVDTGDKSAGGADKT
jgi:hypothetical protein